MIYAAVFHITSQLNQFLKRSFDLNEDIVVVSNIVEQDGSIATNVANRIVASLINIEKDTAPGGRPITAPREGQPSAASYPPVHTNLYLLFAGNFNGKNYAEALKFLSHTISFFQRNPLFTQQNSPELDHRIAKLSLDIENLNIKDLSSLWSVLSGKYLPSVLYKIRMITFDAQDITTRVPKLVEPKTIAAS
ncbi:MAG: DUF4255 domain-containing protein [Desulfatitalea sp.]|nr:DUF4255 domain-containing protein [Desulfatitalea sp.]NNK00623.1 DUF4255 domain-containing protein [Desulfatitalea sp.]